MATIEGSRKPVRSGQPSSKRTTTPRPLPSKASLSKPTGSLEGQASQALQQHDEWMNQLETTELPPDFGTAMEHLDALRKVCERVLTEEEEL